MFKFVINITLIAVITGCPAKTFSQCENSWTAHIKNNDTTWSEVGIRGTAIDKEDNVFVTGYFFKKATFDSITLTNSDTVPSIPLDFFAAKYDNNGNAIWAKKAECLLNDEGRDITIDSLGNVYIAGYFEDSIRFDSILLISKGIYNYLENSFFVKYDNNGNVLWAKSVTSPLRVGIENIRTDIFNNVFISGHFYDSAFFDTNILYGQSADFFIAKYNSNGNFLWARSYGGASGQWVDDIELHNGFLYMKGVFVSEITFDSSIILYSSDTLIESIFIAKYDTAGNFIWAKKISSQYNLSSVNKQRGISIDVNSNCYITGWYIDNITFDTITLYGNNIASIFIAKYDSSGNLLWAKNLTGGYGTGYDVIVDDQEDLYLTASFGNNISFNNNDTIYGNYNRTGIIIKFDKDGNYICSKKVILNDTVNSSSGGGGSIVFSGNDNIILAGTFLNSCTFDTTFLTAGKIYDSFIWKTCLQAPTADFSYLGSQLTLTFTDLSFDATSHFWDFGDGNFDAVQNPTHTFSDSGAYNVCLFVTNNCGMDTVCKMITFPDSVIIPDTVIITVPDESDIFIPNVFSPNGDSNNDVFYIYGKGIKDILFVVYDRWGEKVYEAKEVTNGQNGEIIAGWDGTFENKPLNPAVFVYHLEANDGEILKQGNIALIR